MNKTPFFSIIIPVYNVEAYIARCLDSCISQTYHNIEIIVVDDCGSDNSMAIAQEYAQRDGRIKIIHNSQNLGTFSSRLNGARVASGLYYLFVDSDDFIKHETCEVLHQKIQSDYQSTKEWCDFCCFGMEFYPKALIKDKKAIVITELLKGSEIIKNFFILTDTPPWSICMKTYRNTLIKKVDDFIQQNLPMASRLMMAEDALKFFIITLFAKKSMGIKNELYCYCENPCSITRREDHHSILIKIHQIKKIIYCLSKIKKMYINENIDMVNLAIEKLQKILMYSICFLKSKQNASFKYPISLYNSLKYKHRWQTYVKILCYLLTFGKIKL